MRRLGRRRFLAWTVAGAAAGGGGLLVGARTCEGPRGPAHGLHILTPREARVVAAIGDRLVAPERAAVAATVDAMLVDLPASDIRDLRRLIGFVQRGAPALTGHPRCFTALTPEAQDAVLAALSSSRSASLRGGFEALKSLAFLALYREPSTWTAIGYPGPVVCYAR